MTKFCHIDHQAKSLYVLTLLLSKFEFKIKMLIRFYLLFYLLFLRYFYFITLKLIF
jgi:hypothetical protein